MAFIDYRTKEDMQDDTLKIVAGCLLKLEYALEQQDIRLCLHALRFLYGMVASRMEDKGVDDRLERAVSEFHGPQQLDPAGMSRILDECYKLTRDMCRVLDENKLLFRARADLDALVTQGGQQ